MGYLMQNPVSTYLWKWANMKKKRYSKDDFIDNWIISLEIIYFISMYKKDLALNDLQWLIYHKTKPHQYEKE